MSDSPAHSASLACRNCGTAAPMNFCPACGQETVQHPPTVREFVHEFASHYVAIDGPLLRTLRALLFAPGKLTAEYLAGRKRAYVLPLKLYLTVSLVVWLGLGITQAMRMGEGPFAHADLRSVDVINVGLAWPRVTIRDGVLACSGLPDALCDHVRHRYQVPDESLRVELNHIATRIFSNLAYAMFGVVGLFAVCTRFAFARAGLRYGEHLVFAFHVHGVGLLAVFAAALLPAAIGLGLLLPYGAWYLVMACRRVFGGSWGSLLARCALVALADIILILFATALAGMVSALA